MLRCLLVLLSVGVLSQKQTVQENDGSFNLNPVLEQDESLEDSANDWVNQIISESSQKQTVQENDGSFNLNPVVDRKFLTYGLPKVPGWRSPYEDESLEDSANDWVNQIISESSQKQTVQENDGSFNLYPVVDKDESLEDSANDWVNQIISESLQNANNTIHVNKSPKPGKVGEDPASIWINQILSESLHNTSTTTEVNRPEAERCTTRDNKSGVCVPRKQCDPEYNTITEDGTTAIIFRSNGTCRRYLAVCCRLDKLVSTNHQKERINPLILDSNVKEDSNNGSNKADLDKCGWGNAALNVFRPPIKDNAGPYYADYGEFPWMIAMMRKLNDTDEWTYGKTYLGGGALIHPSVVITAAHVVKDRIIETLKCRAGEWDTLTIYEIFPHQERNVKKIIIHPGYYRPSLYNDMGLVFLESPFDLQINLNIGLVCVAEVLPPPGTTCYGMGWGRTIAKKYALLLKKTLLPLVGAEECQNILSTERLGPYFKLHESLTCAGGKNRLDMCKGDGGSPLVCPVGMNNMSTRYVIVGMTAYGLGCNRNNIPGVFVKVPHLKSWIDNTMAAEGHSSDSYTY